ncbi:phage baseplate assembly protein V [Aliiroseovarius sp. YM-037]|uniref:phage baseplate assembly protein V n=1 Tax=Aliiroseovarius sp. YM-037 TaxID=3341728 RepID=UPI003A8116AD
MPDGPAQTLDDKVFGKHKGTVTNSTDPERRGRLQALVPEVLGAVPTGWAEPCVPYAGIGAGFFSLPLPGVGVWIEFEGGDVSRPIWTGCYWGTGEAPMPPPAGPLGDQTKKIWRSDLGLSAVLDDATQTMTMSDATGENKVEISVATGTVTVKGLARVVHDGQVVQVGSGAAPHPGVFGDALMTYLGQLVLAFNTHSHPGQLAAAVLPVTPSPPVAPMQPPPPSLISTKVFLE